MENRKNLIRQYKEQKRFMGAFIIRSTNDQKSWVGTSPNLESAYNRISFTLKQGSSHDKELQESWCKNGAEDFTFEVLESVEFEADSNFRKAALSLLKDKYSQITNSKPLIG